MIQLSAAIQQCSRVTGGVREECRGGVAKDGKDRVPLQQAVDEFACVR